MPTPYAQQKQKQKEEIQYLKSRISFPDLVARYMQVPSLGHKRQVAVHCPFHTEDTPSFNLFYDHGYCFGHGESYDHIKFIQQLRGYSFQQALDELRAIAGVSKDKPRSFIPPLILPKQRPPLNQTDAWQAYAEQVVYRSITRLNFDDGGSLTQLRGYGANGRGFTPSTIARFEIGWTGNKPIRTKLNNPDGCYGDVYLNIPAYAYTFPVRDENGRIRALKWRNTVLTPRTMPDGSTRKPGKYEQLTGSTTGLFNQLAALSQSNIVLAKGEFDTMLLCQLEIEATCHTGGEQATIDYSLFQSKPVVYITDNDNPGREAARKRQGQYNLLSVARPPLGFKDIGEWYISTQGGITRETITKEVLAKAKRSNAKGRCKTRQIIFTNEEINALQQQSGQWESATLQEARELLTLETKAVYEHPKRFKRNFDVLHLAAPPGVGKGFAVNDVATRRLIESHFRQRTLFVGSRKNMITDQKRDPEHWQQIKGRQSALNAVNKPVDFFDESANEAGNCTVVGEKYHHKMAAKGWEAKSFIYCHEECPVKELCEKKGYYSQFDVKRVKRNAYTTYAHLFTGTVAKDYQIIIVDEITASEFVKVDQIADKDIYELLAYTQDNYGMKWILKSIRQMFKDLGALIPDELSEDPAPIDIDIDTELCPTSTSTSMDLGLDLEKSSQQHSATTITGIEFYRILDQACHNLTSGKKGLLDLLDLATKAESGEDWYSTKLASALSDRTPEGVDLLPRNFWQPSGLNPMPGTGGLYDVLKAEAKAALLSTEEDGEKKDKGKENFISRVEIVKTPSTAKRPAKVVLRLFRRRYLSPEVVSKPIIVLDGTGDSELFKVLFQSWEAPSNSNSKEEKRIEKWIANKAPRIKVVAPSVAFPENVEIIQETCKNYSTSSLVTSLRSNDYYGRQSYWRSFVSRVCHHINQIEPGKRTVIICALKAESALKKAIAEKGLLTTSDITVVDHYGGIRGSNAYSDYDQIILAGLYMSNPQAVISCFKSLYANSTGIHLPGTGNLIGFSPDMARTVKRHNIIMPDGTGFEDEVMEFVYPPLQSLMSRVSEDEMIQALHRIRPIGATVPKRVVLLFGYPLKGIVPTELDTSSATPLHPYENDTSEQQQQHGHNERTKTALEKLVAKVQELADTQGIFTRKEVMETCGISQGFVYRNFEAALLLAKCKLLEIPCIEVLYTGGVIERTLVAGIKTVSSLDSVSYHLPQEKLPQRWEIRLGFQPVSSLVM